MPSSKDKYTDPNLRDEIKEDIQQSDKGGAPGQWSARKAQMMAKEYKNRGGGYKTDKKDQDESQKHLSKWTEEEWQTKEGSGYAKKDDGTRKRYLPKKAWEDMSEKEKEQTDQKKQKESKQGKQFVQNTPRAKSARKKASDEENAAHEQREKKETTKDEGGRETRSRSMARGKRDNLQSDSDPEKREHANIRTKQGQASLKAGQKRDRGQDSTSDETTSTPRKRHKDQAETSEIQPNGSSISTNGRADAPAQPASQSRLPAQGQTAHWKTTSGWTEGSVVEVLKANKKVNGKQVKATEADPRIVLKSNSSGKTCVHNPANVYFD
ncbi:uncharacterized protein Z520_09467 [Fonsecaea multimorphosa CBS 102226]|uniref:Hypervirulence associated protein TUDOR domain-containing protein n=1 Tax=Fonsecaea multimorphosa CBS 102226 TaxID=1442371 RepID=A0A0D2JN45_9EURO|nr:uncharacterized protein Z520_09467 [Fonsecaea multimorphosa CBS 102226]KIX94777.1 hypothetical protein Z520_09467 [Fonsecaea multimorphosa CBS 102226]OAL20551.1 hypothetical protein AYO22_08852 [Fonsecaea multimorphosa]